MMFVRSKAGYLSDSCFMAAFKFPLIISLIFAYEELGEPLNFYNYGYFKSICTPNGARFNNVFLHFVLCGCNFLVCSVF